MASVQAYHFQDLGSNPRSPTFFVIFLLQVITCTSKHAAHHTPSHIQQPDGQRPDLVIQAESPPWSQVQVRTQNPKSQTRPALNGPQHCYMHHKIQAQTSLSLSLFYLFCLLIVFIIFVFNSNQSLKFFLFKIKSHQNIFI